MISVFYFVSYKLIPKLIPVGLESALPVFHFDIRIPRSPSFLYRNEAKVNVIGSVRCFEFVFLEE